MNKTTILLADDHTLVREVWTFIINSHPELLVVAEVGSAEEAIEKVKLLRPDIVILDINLPGMNGIDATREIRKFSPVTKVLGVSMHTQPVYAKRMIKEGAMGYVTKNSPREKMFEAIASLRRGEKFICDEIKNNIANEIMQVADGNRGINQLTAKELEIMRLIKDGLTSKEIATALSIVPKTVEVHRYNILKKLQLRNTAALVNFMNEKQIEFTH